MQCFPEARLEPWQRRVTAHGEHTTAIGGKGKGITGADLVQLGEPAGLGGKWCMDTEREICGIVYEEPGKYVD